MFGWLRRLFTTEPHWESVPYRPYRCAGCDQVIQRNQKARRCHCQGGAALRHASCMTGPGGTCPFCQLSGVTIVWQ
jgi:hypothetical protein